MDAALDQLDREHKSLTSEAAMPELPNQSLAWEDLSALDRRTAQLSTWDGFNVPGSLGVAVCPRAESAVTSGVPAGRRAVRCLTHQRNASGRQQAALTTAA